jgi:probable rRNA maturation factor
MPTRLMALSLQFAPFNGLAAHRAVLGRGQVLRWLGHALPGAFEITVRVVGEAEGRTLNLQFRGKDHATNVLTFQYAQNPSVTADLVLCAPVIEREAREQGKTLEAHYAHLLVHGALHAKGYDHETSEADALEMESLEILLMMSLGFECPY